MTANMTALYIIKPSGSINFKFGVTDDPDATIDEYTLGVEKAYILKHPRAARVELCLREYLASRDVLYVGMAEGTASAGEGDAILHAALGIATSAGATLSTPATLPAPLAMPRVRTGTVALDYEALAAMSYGWTLDGSRLVPPPPSVPQQTWCRLVSKQSLT